LWSYGGLKSQDVEKNYFFAFSEKNDPSWGIFPHSVPKGFIATAIDVLYSNFVKFCRRKIGKIVGCVT